MVLASCCCFLYEFVLNVFHDVSFLGIFLNVSVFSMVSYLTLKTLVPSCLFLICVSYRCFPPCDHLHVLPVSYYVSRLNTFNYYHPLCVLSPCAQVFLCHIVASSMGSFVSCELPQSFSVFLNC